MEPILYSLQAVLRAAWILASSLSVYACSSGAARVLLREAKGPLVPTHSELLWVCPKGTSVNKDHRNLCTKLLWRRLWMRARQFRAGPLRNDEEFISGIKHKSRSDCSSALHLNIR